MVSLKVDLFKDITKAIKYTIVIGDLGLTIHCLFLLFGLNIPLFEFVFGFSLTGFVIMLLATYLLGFCNLTRAFLIHGFAVRCCIIYQEYIGFGCALTIARIIMLLLGIVLFIVLIKNRVKFETCGAEEVSE